MAAVTSRYIEIPGMNNTRDLGGMHTKDGGVIRPNMLYRSSRLSSLEAPEWFTENVALIVDMRSSRETTENPDPQIPGVEYLHLPIFECRPRASPGTKNLKGEWLRRIPRPRLRAWRRYTPAL